MPNLQSLDRELAAFKNRQTIAKAMKMTVAVEHDARKEAMDGATGNAGQLIKKVTCITTRPVRPPFPKN
jgi:F0F1-type ATP synthase gamma subunit